MNQVRNSREPWSSTRGQSLVEFALVLPMLLLVAFIITEFGRALWIKNALTEASGNAARAAIVATSSTYQAAADSAANRILHPMGMGTQDANPSVLTAVVLTQSGTQVVHVTITRVFSFIPGGPLPTAPGGKNRTVNLNNITIVGESTMDTQPNFGS